MLFYRRWHIPRTAPCFEYKSMHHACVDYTTAGRPAFRLHACQLTMTEAMTHMWFLSLDQWPWLELLNEPWD